MMNQPRPPFDSALVTGAAGYVGMALVHKLLGEGVAVVGLDRLSRGRPQGVPITVPITRGDIRDSEAVRTAMQRLPRPPEVVFHLAGVARISDSIAHPQRYMDINVGGTQVVMDAALEAGVGCVVLASTAAVLASAAGAQEPLDEDAVVGPQTPYGHSKLAAERTLEAATGTGRIAGVVARLFNPAGAAYGCAERHEPETHLLPLALLAAAGKRGPLQVFGDDHPTPDGTCVRDYVHVADVVESLFLAAARQLERFRGGFDGFELLHIASGEGSSVREVLQAVERVLGNPVPWQLAPRRPGDVSSVIGCGARARLALNAPLSGDIERMLRDAAEAMQLSPAAPGPTIH